MRHGHRDLGNHVASVTGHYGRTDNLVRAFLDVDFDKAFILAIQDRPIDIGELLHIRIDFDPLHIRLPFV